MFRGRCPPEWPFFLELRQEPRPSVGIVSLEHLINDSQLDRMEELEIDVLPLVHPRQAARSGSFSEDWYETHQEWLRTRTEEHRNG